MPRKPTGDPPPDPRRDELDIGFTRAGRNGTYALTASIGGEVIHADKVHLVQASERDRFAADLVNKCPAADPTEVDRQLLGIVGLLQEADEAPQEPETHAVALLRIAGRAALFHASDGRTFARVPVAEHLEVHPIRSASFRRWLVREFYGEREAPPSTEAMQSALGVLEAKAQFDGPTEPVWVRVAGMPSLDNPDDPTYYVDLGDDAWRAARISRDGWEVVDSPPVHFRRPKGMLALPSPVPGGSLDELRTFVNVGTDQDWYLVVAALTGALRPHGPYPILAIQGEQGSAKSTTARVVRKAIDPNATLLRCEPREVRDLMIAATNTWSITLDNLSSLPPWLADAICRLATGGGYATRMLYADDEEMFFDAMRPVVLNGIDDFATRPDLLDRCIVLTLPTIGEDRRQEETPFWRAFDAAHPRILGALFDALSGGLRMLPSTRPNRLPRMADFARWGVAVGRALGWPEGAFLDAYEANRSSVDEQAVEASPVALAVVQFLESSGRWEGSAGDLLAQLNGIVSERTSKAKGWPQTPRALSGELRRVAPVLRKLGSDVSFTKARRRRLIRMEANTAESGADSPPPPSPPSPPSPGHAELPETRRDGPSPPSPGHRSPGDARDGGDGGPSPVETVGLPSGDGGDPRDGGDGRPASFLGNRDRVEVDL